MIIKGSIYMLNWLNNKEVIAENVKVEINRVQPKLQGSTVVYQIGSFIKIYADSLSNIRFPSRSAKYVIISDSGDESYEFELSQFGPCPVEQYENHIIVRIA